MNELYITVIQLSGDSYFWVLRNAHEYGKILASSRLIGARETVITEAHILSTKLGLPVPTIEER